MDRDQLTARGPHPRAPYARDPYDWLLKSYVWRFSAAGRLGLAAPRDAAIRAMGRILEGVQECSRDYGQPGARREEFREIVYRIVNNLRRISEQVQALPPGAAAALDALEKEYDIVDPREIGLGDVVDWRTSNVSSSRLGEPEASPDTTLRVIVQRRLEELMADAQEGRFLAEAFIAPTNWIRWTCGDRPHPAGRPGIEGAAGSQSGRLAVSFTHTHRFGEPREYQHVYGYDMTWSAGEYRFDFALLNQGDARAAFGLDRGFLRGEKRIGHPGETVITVQREAWLMGSYQHLNVYMPAILRILMFDALCVWMKELRERA